MDFNLSFVYMYRILTVNVVCLQAECPPLIECQLCHMTFSDQSTISTHYDTEHRQPTRRRRAEHGTGNHECDICGKRYSVKQMLNIHRASAHGIGEVPSFQCEHCSRKFNHKGTLKQHLSLIHRKGDVNEYKCDICCKVFNVKGSYNRHMAVAHGVGDWKTFPCDVCGKLLGDKTKLKRHLAGVHGVGD